MSNQMIIDVQNNHVLTESMVNSTDPNNVLSGTIAKGTEYTATEDCIAKCYMLTSNSYGQVYIDGIEVIYQQSGGDSRNTYLVYVKKGQKIKVTNSNSSSSTCIQNVYGIKR